MMKAFPQWTRDQLMRGVYQTRKQFPEIERLQEGVWRFVNTSEAASAVDEGCFTVKLVKEREDGMIVVDEAGDVYKMILLG
jgi:hypothetical protein